MLSAADSDLASRDTELRCLADALDANVVTKLISSRVDENSGMALQRRYIRYKPGINCLVRYTGHLNGSPLDCYIKTYGSDSEVKLAKAKTRPVFDVPSAPGRLIFREHASVITFYPNDDKLKSLRSFKNGRMSRSLQAALFPSQPESNKYTIKPLAYKPERRFVAYSQDDSGRESVIKLYSSESYNNALARAQLASQLMGMPLPRLQTSSDEHCTLTFNWQEGRTLFEMLAREDYDSERIVQTGDSLARLHELNPTRLLSSYSVKQDIYRITSFAGGLVMLLPDQQTEIWQLSEEIIQGLQRVEHECVVTHGDFYAKQVLINDKSIFFLDTDELHLGDPARDLANFIAHLEYDRLTGNISASIMHNTVDALLESYRRRNNTVKDDRLAIHVAFSLFHLAHAPFREGASNWPDRIDKIISACWQWVEASRRSSSKFDLLVR